MKFSLNKLRTALGNNKVQEDNVPENQIEAIIKDIDNTPLATSDSNVLYAGFSELGGYHFMQTVIVGSFHLKTIKGAHLECFGADGQIILKSDMNELESNHSGVSNRYITPIDFQIEEEDILKIESAKINKLVLSAKKKTVTFMVYTAND